MIAGLSKPRFRVVVLSAIVAFAVTMILKRVVPYDILGKPLNDPPPLVPANQATDTAINAASSIASAMVP